MLILGFCSKLQCIHQAPLTRQTGKEPDSSDWDRAEKAITGNMRDVCPPSPLQPH